MVKTATPKRRQNWHGQNGDKSKRRQTKTATGQNSAKSKRRQKLCVIKLLMKRTIMIYSLCIRLSYLKRRVIDVTCFELLWAMSFFVLDASGDFML